MLEPENINTCLAQGEQRNMRGGHHKKRETGMNLTIETDREDDGRWIAEAPELPGVLCYGATQREAIAKAEALTLSVIAEQLDHGEAQPLEFSFAVAAD
jgi:predicted RNase H-like HicB family nuclease